MDWQAAGLSLRLALATSVILFVFGVPFAYWLFRSRLKGTFLIEALVTLPLVLPPSVLGFYLLVAMSPLSPLGHFFLKLTGTTLPFSFPGLLVGSAIYSLPFAVQPFLAAFQSIDRGLIEASKTLSVSESQTFFKMVLPLSRNGLITGFIMSFAHTLGEFGVVLMIGGNIPGQTRTLSISIYDSVQALDYQSASETASLLLAVSFLVLVATTLLKRRGNTSWQIV